MKPGTDVREISVSVMGLPPAKDGGFSIFHQKHSRHSLVVELLSKAEKALTDSHWNPVETRKIGLELVVETPGDIPGDAINYLGGVADVLQSIRVNVDLSHLGGLAEATFYRNDKQIAEVRYSVEYCETRRYRVRVWLL